MVWKMLTLHILFPYFVSKMRVINMTFCYTADKMESGENIVRQRKVWENENLK